MSFTDIFTADDAAEMIAELGEGITLTIAGVPHQLLGVPSTVPRRTGSNSVEFAGELVEIDVSRLHLPPGTTNAVLKNPTTTIKLSERQGRDMRISDLTDAGQSIVRLVCEP